MISNNTQQSTKRSRLVDSVLAIRNEMSTVGTEKTNNPKMLAAGEALTEPSSSSKQENVLRMSNLSRP